MHSWVGEHVIRGARVSMLKRLVEEYRSSRDPHTWNRIKREVAELVAFIVLSLLGPENVIGIYYTDLVGGEEASVSPFTGRDVDVIIWVERDTNIDVEGLERELELHLREVMRTHLDMELEEVVGPNLVEIHVVRDPRKDPYGKLITSFLTPAIPIWVRKTPRPLGARSGQARYRAALGAF